MTDPGTRRHLVRHDCGMGDVWWWVRAVSAEEIVLRCADVEVVTAPETVERAAKWNLREVDLDAPDPNPLSGLRARRDAQRDRPGFGALTARDRVYVRRRWENEEDGSEEIYLLEFDADGRRLRQVEIAADGDAVRTTEEDWVFNPPFDLYDPVWAPWEISRDDFEEAWQRARPESGGSGWTEPASST